MIAYIMEAALRSLLLALVVWLGMTVLRVRNPQVQKITWMTVLAGAIAMPALMQIPLLLHWQLLSAEPLVAFALPGVAIHGIRLDSSPQWREMLTGLYLAGVFVLLLRLSVGLARMWRASQAAAPVREAWALGADIRVTPALSSPGTFGSIILLPESYINWSHISRAAIIEHERAHVRHRDSLVQWLAALHACIFWFSPVAWWLRRRLAELAEQVSDDSVLDGHVERSDYADVLLQVARARQSTGMSLVSSMANGGVAKRIERILADDYCVRRPARWWLALAIVAVMPLIALSSGATASNASGAIASNDPASGDYSLPTSPSGLRIVESPSLAELERWYPPQAADDGIDGAVQIAVTLDEAGRATDTLVLSEFPLGAGFGSAASGLAHAFKYANPTGRPGTLTFRVKFALRK